MLPTLRRDFNARFTPALYQRFLGDLASASGVPVPFRISETPCFFSPALLEKMALYGSELIEQLIGNPLYRRAAAGVVPERWNVPGEPEHPLFIQADFGLDANLEPKLVEIQAFPSLYAFQPVLAGQYIESFGLGPDLRFLLGSLDRPAYEELVRRAILGNCRPEETVLIDIHPSEQKTLPDFLLTEKLAGISTICLTALRRDGRYLYYERDGRRVPIRRIYNRVIFDELERKGIEPPVPLTGEYDVEWAGHPNWYFRISKFSIPFLSHPSVPKSWFLDKLPAVPPDLENYVLKPLFSFAGIGVKVGLTQAAIDSIPEAERASYILQERVDFVPLIDTPFGKTKVEVRIMYIWLDKLQAVAPLLRMGRGAQMGVDHNKQMEWVGGSAALMPLP